MLKVIIVILLIAVVASLVSGLTFLYKDTDRTDSRRTLYALGIRVSLAALLLATVFYGVVTGQLDFGRNAPWHRAQPAEPSNQYDGSTKRTRLRYVDTYGT